MWPEGGTGREELGLRGPRTWPKARGQRPEGLDWDLREGLGQREGLGWRGPETRPEGGTGNRGSLGLSLGLVRTSLGLGQRAAGPERPCAIGRDWTTEREGFCSHSREVAKSLSVQRAST